MTMTFCSVTTLWWALFGSVVREIKRMPTCVRQIRDLLTHVVQPAEDDGTPQLRVWLDSSGLFDS